MSPSNIKRLLLLTIVLALALPFPGCGNGDQENAGLDNEYEVEEAPIVEKDEPDNKVEAVDPDTSDLWAPAADKSLGVNLPKKDDVPYPAFPGAHVHNYGYAGENQESAVIWLITTEPPDNVFAFYQEQLEGWHFEESQREGFSYLLWQGEVGDAQHVYTHLIPAILIREPYEMELEYMDEWLPGTQTEITVVYSAD